MLIDVWHYPCEVFIDSEIGMELRSLITHLLAPPCFFLFAITQSLGQGNSVFVAPSYEKILLNGVPTYRNVASGVFSSGSPNEEFLTAITEVATRANVYDDCWDNNKFIAYPEEDLSWPIYLTFADSSYAKPINRSMVVTSRYGWRGGKAHHGIDIDLITGDLVMALLPGKVRLVKYVSGMGKTVVVRHDNGLETVYGHLSKQFVNVDQMVEKGQPLGRGGTTGNARGSHLHLEVRFRGKSINPELLFDFSEAGKITASEVEVTKYWATPRKHRSTRKSMIEPKKPTQLAKPAKLVKLTPETMEKRQEPVKREASSKPTKVKEPINSHRHRIPVLSAPDLGEDGIYVVQEGDTLFSIAKRYQVTVDDIRAKNRIGDRFVIRVGQSLVVAD